MTSPLQLIKEGILSGNWDTVRSGYTALTGDSLEQSQESTLETPKKKRGRPKKTDGIPVVVEQEAEVVTKKEGEKTYTRAEQIKPGFNQFHKIAKQIESDPHLKEELAQASSINDNVVHARSNRPPVNKKLVKCHICGTEKYLTAELAYKYNESNPYHMMFRCDDCCSGGSGRKQPRRESLGRR